MKISQLSAGVLLSLLTCINPVLADADNKGCSAGQDLSTTPPHQIGMYLDGYHSYKREENLAGDKQQQIRTAHFCKQVSPDLFQCLIYDGNTKDARCIGVEYVITEKAFKALPDAEKKLWHAHNDEVDSGLLVMPGMPKEQEKAILGTLRSTYGKTWQTWNNLGDAIPLGEPALMWNVDPKKISQVTKKSVAVREVSPTY